MPNPDDEFTALVDAQIDRVDLVGKAANGTTFLIAKQAGDSQGLLDPTFIRDLIGKSQPDPEPVSEDRVTMTGSPGAIAKLIHQAAQRQNAEQVAKAKYDTDDRKSMAGHEAMNDGSYPIADRADLGNAIHAVGRGGADHNAIRRHVIARAKALGASSEIPDNWNADGSLKGAVAKETEMDDDALDPTTVLADPDGDAPGMDTDPGSPAWEAVDAATARKWTSILSRAKAALGVMSDREALEAATVDPSDAENAYDLDDAACAIDYAISVLAPFAVDEQAEADCGGDMAAVGKALAGFDLEPLDTIEALAQVAKAGRSLSAANEAAIRGAVESLTKVLASLPAPTPDDSGQSVAKETHMADTEAVNTEPVDEDVAKADGDKPEMVAIYDKNGNLVGIVDPDKITRIAGADSADDTQASDDDAPDTTDAAPAADPTDLTPAPAAEVGTPADAASDDDITKQTDTTTDDVLKSSITDMVKGILDDHSATQAAEIAKSRDAVLELAGLVDTLKGQVQALEEQPAAPRVFTNGATPPAHMLRGQDQGAIPADIARAQDLKKSLGGNATAAEQNAAANEMQEMAIARLREIQRS